MARAKKEASKPRTKAAGRKSAAPAVAGDDLHDHMISAAGLEGEIRQRAYELYEGRGRQEGHEQEDWLRAEHEVLERHGIKRTA